MSRVVRLLAVLGLLLGVLLGVPVGFAPAAQARASTVVVTVEDVSPNVPSASKTPSPMTFTVRVTNPTDQAYRDVRLVAERDGTIADQPGLTTEFATTRAPQDGLSVPPVTDVVIANLPASGTVVVPYTITTGTIDGSVSLCLCQRVIYPIWFGAEVTGSDGSATVLGGTRTLVPSLVGEPAPAPTRVAWVWPLIDRPHRLASDTEFLDDDLATSVGIGGRLDRALQVVERVGADVPITLVIDPELLDELEVMATRSYTVRTASGSATQGTGRAAAVSWLNRLTAVLTTDERVQVSLTPFGDPDQQSLVDQDQRWATTLPEKMGERVAAALAGRSPSTDVVWPAGGAISGSTLRALVADGAGTLVLGQSGLRASQRKKNLTAVRLRSGSAAAAAALTLPTTQTAAAQVVTLGAQGLRLLPRLVATVAIRSVVSPTKPTFLVITPPRYVDPVPDNAERAILATSTGAAATAVSVRTGAAGAVVAGRLSDSLPAIPTLPAAAVTAIDGVDAGLPVLKSLLDPSTPPNAANLLASLAAARQRTTSSAWTDSTAATAIGGGPDPGTTLAREVQSSVTSLLHGVHIVKPSSGSYTLASSDSTLPISVRNDLAYAVNLHVDVRTVDNLPGFTADPPKSKTVAAHSQLTFQIRATVDRSGVIPVEAQIATSGDTRLGRPVRLTIHSTVLGKVGVVITAVAGGVLVIALLVRFVTHLRRRRRRRAKRQAPVVPEREPAA